MEALTKRRETDQRVQKIVRKNIRFISEKLPLRGVIDYLFEKEVLTRENYEQLQIDLGKFTETRVNIKLFLDILFRKENYWINTIKAIRSCEPQSSVADLIESVLPDSDKRKLDSWYTRHGIKTQDEESHCSSVTDSDVDTSSRVGTDRDFTTRKKILYQAGPGRPQTSRRRSRRSVNGGTVRRKHGNGTEDNEKQYFGQNGYYDTNDRSKGSRHGYKTPERSDKMNGHLRSDHISCRTLSNDEYDLLRNTNELDSQSESESPVSHQHYPYKNGVELNRSGQQRLLPQQLNDKKYYETSYRKRESFSPMSVMLNIPSPEVLPNPPQRGRNESNLDPTRELWYQSTEEAGANRNGEGRNLGQPCGQPMVVDGCNYSDRDSGRIVQQNVSRQSEIGEISERMESQCTIDTDQPETNSGTDSDETGSYETECTESEVESIEMGPTIPLSTAAPSQDGPAHIGSQAQAPRHVYGSEQQIPPPAISQPITRWPFTPTPLPQGVPTQSYMPTGNNPSPQYYFAAAIPMNHLYQSTASYNTFFMSQQQTMQRPQLTQPPSATNQLAAHAVLGNVAFMSAPSTSTVGTNQTSGNQQPTQTTQPPTNTRTTNSVDGSKDNGNTTNGNKDDQQHNLTAAPQVPDSQTLASAETIATREECNLEEMPTSTSETVIFSSKDSQTDASLFKDTNPKLWTSMEYQNKATPFRVYQPFNSEPTSPCADNTSDMCDSLD